MANVLHDKVKELRDELYRDGWGRDIDPDLAHVRDVVDKLLDIVEELSVRERRERGR